MSVRERYYYDLIISRETKRCPITLLDRAILQIQDPIFTTLLPPLAMHFWQCSSFLGVGSSAELCYPVLSYCWNITHSLAVFTSTAWFAEMFSKWMSVVTLSFSSSRYYDTSLLCIHCHVRWYFAWLLSATRQSKWFICGKI